ncbi:hypothetical protein TCON_2210 [Astathelohania contejeani]|uniref:Exocyst complex component EXOC6/Sec15 N-terminal domain-containing protein n=1 Tax=Astathelohania contejeani TaxID=164912 RepID=A0ABQ7HWP3_9MICR|nr:hypothetical protein TCON_2210 [Thelohania contejeani]
MTFIHLRNRIPSNMQHLSGESKSLLQNIINKNEYLTTTQEIEEQLALQEELLQQQISKHYLQIIQSCAGLRTLGTQISKMTELNRNINLSINEIGLKIISRKDEICSISLIEERIDQLLKVFKKLYIIFENIVSFNKIIDDTAPQSLYQCYRLCDALTSDILYFKNYKFHNQLESLLKKYKNKFFNKLKEEVDKWCTNMSQSYLEIGKQYDQKSNSLIFGSSTKDNSTLVQIKCCCFVYEKFGMKKQMVKYINKARMGMIDRFVEKINDEKNMIDMFIGFMTIEIDLIKYDSLFNLHEYYISIIRKIIERLPIQTSKDKLLKLQKFLCSNDFEFSVVEEDLESKCYRCINDYKNNMVEGGKRFEIVELDEELNKFVNMGLELIDGLNQSSTELNEILMKCIDEILCWAFEDHEVREYERFVNRFIKNLEDELKEKNILLSYQFRIQKLIREKNVEENQKNIKKVIGDFDNIFLSYRPGPEFNKNLKDLVVNIRDNDYDNSVIDSLVDHICKKYLKIIDNENDIIGEITIVYGILKSYLGDKSKKFEEIVKSTKYN